MFMLTSKSARLRSTIAALALVMATGLQAQTSSSAFVASAAATTGLPSTPSSTAIPGLTSSTAKIMTGPQEATSPSATSSPESAKSSSETSAADANRVRPPPRASEPSQFQRFVQQSTGRLLPMYGHDLFNSPNYTAASTPPAPDDYLLGPGDEVLLQVWGPVDFSTHLTLDRNGQVNLPKVGVLTLAGVAVRDLEKTLQTHLGKVFTNFRANATLGRLRGIQVYVVGQAQQPGTFHLSSLSTLVSALFASGGPNANGSMRNIDLKRAGKTISTIDLYDFIARGDKTRDLALLSGDIIVIPPVGERVAVTGAFDQAAIYEMKAGATRVADILSLGGGVPALATTQKALLERITRQSNPPRQVHELVLNEQGLREPLRDGDVLTLLGISPAFSNAVTLQGTVADPLRYRWFEGMKILDLIPERDALITRDYYKRKNLLVQNVEANQATSVNITTRIRSQNDQINWDYAVIERMDRSKLTTELIPFNLGKAVLQRDPEHNLPLQAGDVITILNQTDLRVPQDRRTRLVRVEGEVGAPGVYQTTPGETLPQLIRRVGGLTSQAYLFGTEFNRESVRSRQQENLDTLTRRLEAQFQSQIGSLAANRTSDNPAQAQQQVQQQAQLKSQIDRLKNAKSNGRMSLELDPKAQTLAALPTLPLENGDHIFVPATPGFVSAIGSVNNENVFIYKPGKTVGEVLKSAGLSEDAEPGETFVLRADGSIIGRRDHSGLFGGNFESLPVMPGDTLVVPAQLNRESRYNLVTRTVKDWTQILANLGLGVAAINTLRK